MAASGRKRERGKVTGWVGLERFDEGLAHTRLFVESLLVIRGGGKRDRGLRNGARRSLASLAGPVWARRAPPGCARCNRRALSRSAA
eukprot:5055798-Pleurochrysis_carterae.AAC.1